MSNLQPEYNVDLKLKDNLENALKMITKVSTYAKETERLIAFAKFCFFKEPRMTSARYYIDKEDCEFDTQIGITICPDDFIVQEKRTKAPKHGAWIRLSELNEHETSKFIVGSGASSWVNVLAVRVDDTFNTEDLRLSCIGCLNELYVGQLTTIGLESLDGIADNYRYDNMRINIDSPDAEEWFICPIAEDVE